MADYALPLSGKVALVTGGSRGIGEGIVMELARRGASVIITYVSAKSSERVAEIQARIAALPHAPATHAVRVDLSTLDGATELIEDLKKSQFWRRPQSPQQQEEEEEDQKQQEGSLKIDILVNNAAVESVKTLSDVDVEDYNAVYDLNVRGVILVTQALLPYLCPTSTYPSTSTSTSTSTPTPRDGSRIINIGSVGSRAAFKGLSLYCSSKAALEGLTRCWAAELGADGTTVNCVNPGPVQSEMLDNIPRAIVENQMANTPLQNRLGTVDEVANVVAALAGRDGAWITGQVISASGGWAVY